MGCSQRYVVVAYTAAWGSLTLTCPINTAGAMLLRMRSLLENEVEHCNEVQPRNSAPLTTSRDQCPSRGRPCAPQPSRHYFSEALVSGSPEGCGVSTLYTKSNRASVAPLGLASCVPQKRRYCMEDRYPVCTYRVVSQYRKPYRCFNQHHRFFVAFFVNTGDGAM